MKKGITQVKVSKSDIIKKGCESMAIREDVSNSTIAVLLVLTILVSVVGTWTVLDKTKQKLDQENALTGLAVQDVQNEVDPNQENTLPVPAEEGSDEEIVYQEDEEDKEDKEKNIKENQ